MSSKGLLPLELTELIIYFGGQVRNHYTEERHEFINKFTLLFIDKLHQSPADNDDTTYVIKNNHFNKHPTNNVHSNGIPTTMPIHNSNNNNNNSDANVNLNLNHNLNHAYNHHHNDNYNIASTVVAINDGETQYFVDNGYYHHHHQLQQCEDDGNEFYCDDEFFGYLERNPGNLITIQYLLEQFLPAMIHLRHNCPYSDVVQCCHRMLTEVSRKYNVPELAQKAIAYPYPFSAFLEHHDYSNSNSNSNNNNKNNNSNHNNTNNSNGNREEPQTGPEYGQEMGVELELKSETKTGNDEEDDDPLPAEPPQKNKNANTNTSGGASDGANAETAVVMTELPENSSLDPKNRELLPLHQYLFTLFGRLSHFDLLLSTHGYIPYLKAFRQLFHCLMYDTNVGPLMLDKRHFIALLACSRYSSDALISETEYSFLAMEEADKTWVKTGITVVPHKYRKLNQLNALLAHRPWTIKRSHISDLVQGQHGWRLSELVQAITIMVFYHFLSGMYQGIGITPEYDHYFMRKIQDGNLFAGGSDSAQIRTDIKSVLRFSDECPSEIYAENDANANANANSNSNSMSHSISITDPDHVIELDANSVSANVLHSSLSSTADTVHEHIHADRKEDTEYDECKLEHEVEAEHSPLSKHHSHSHNNHSPTPTSTSTPIPLPSIINDNDNDNDNNNNNSICHNDHNNNNRKNGNMNRGINNNNNNSGGSSASSSSSSSSPSSLLIASDDSSIEEALHALDNVSELLAVSNKEQEELLDSCRSVIGEFKLGFEESANTNLNLETVSAANAIGDTNDEHAVCNGHHRLEFRRVSSSTPKTDNELQSQMQFDPGMAPPPAAAAAPAPSSNSRTAVNGAAIPVIAKSINNNNNNRVELKTNVDNNTNDTTNTSSTVDADNTHKTLKAEHWKRIVELRKQNALVIKSEPRLKRVEIITIEEVITTTESSEDNNSHNNNNNNASRKRGRKKRKKYTKNKAPLKITRKKKVRRRISHKIKNIPTTQGLEYTKYSNHVSTAFSNFDVHNRENSIFFSEFCWNKHGYACLARYYSGIEQYMDEIFRITDEMTDHCINYNMNLNTKPFRSAIWHYSFRLYGINDDTYDYRKVNIWLPIKLKIFIKKIVCYSQIINIGDVRNLGIALKEKEKIHVAILALMAKKQACLLFALRAVTRYMDSH